MMARDKTSKRRRHRHSKSSKKSEKNSNESAAPCLLDLVPSSITNFIFELAINMECDEYSEALTYALHQQMTKQRSRMSRFAPNQGRTKVYKPLKSPRIVLKTGVVGR